MLALVKAKRWLGQKFLTHIFKQWDKALTAADKPSESSEPAKKPRRRPHETKIPDAA